MILAVVQARMGSTRLPGKVMLKVLGKTLIQILLERLKQSKRIDKIILATSFDTSNDVLCEHVQELGFDVFRGSEEDVLERFYLAAKQYNADTIIRVTGDCPLLDPYLYDGLFNAFFQEKADYGELSQKYAEGADGEIFTFRALEKAYQEAKLKSEREHVTLYFNNHLDLFKKYIHSNQTDDSLYRFTVDEPEDFEVVKRIIEELYKDEKDLFSYNKIKEYLNNHSDTYQLNQHIVRNEGLLISLDEDYEVRLEQE